MRVLQVITPSKIAGAERSTTSLCEHLARAGHDVQVVCKAGHALAPVMRAAGLTVVEAPIGGKLNVAAPVRLARLARAMGAEVIHTQLSTAALWGSVAGRWTGIPMVAHVRALNTKTFYQWADRTIAVSHAVKRHLEAQGVPGERIDVVYTGMDPERSTRTIPATEAKARLGIAPEQPTVGVVAHLTAKKGHAVFLEAAARVAARCPEARFLFLGEGVLREALVAQVERLGLCEHVRFLGFHPDVSPLYAAMDVVVLPSIAGEGLPRALLEAGFLGIPVVGTDLSGVPEIVADGETGFIVPLGAPEPLAERMLRLIESEALRGRLGAAAAARIRERFTVPAMVAGTVASYERAQQERRSRSFLLRNSGTGKE
jgi:glycosyltransferase involved in cell wall biosynthesis